MLNVIQNCWRTVARLRSLVESARQASSNGPTPDASGVIQTPTPNSWCGVPESKSSPRGRYLKQALRLCGLAALLGLAACQGIVGGAPQFPLPPPNPNATLQNSVNHIIFMMQENRSFDAYFGKLDDYRAGVFQIGRDADDLESTFSNPADDGTSVSNFHLSTGCIFNTTAAWLESWGDM